MRADEPPRLSVPIEPAIHIDDLGRPHLPPAVQEMAVACEAVADQASLSPAELMSQAEAETRLSDFGDDIFREPLEVLTSALKSEAGLSALGRVSAQQRLVQLLKNRLLIQDVLRRHPEIHDVQIQRPIIIAGLPRTGTTHLHNLISSDPSLRSLPYWESNEPVLADAERPRPGEPDPRLERTERALALLNEAMPYFKRMHEMTTWHVHEEIQLLAIGFSTMLFETMAVMPSWRDWYKVTDQIPYYQYLATVLKVLQWSRGGTRWVLKSPQHLEQFPALLSTFPDATVVVTHRDPVAITASLATMSAYTARLSVASVDPATIGHYWADRIVDMLRACVRDRHLLPESHSSDVLFHDFMAEDMATVEAVYSAAGQPMSPDARMAMERFAREHPRGRHGRVRYDLVDFGLDYQERRNALDFYVSRFKVQTESPGSG